MKNVIFLIALLTLAGCSTSYQEIKQTRAKHEKEVEANATQHHFKKSQLSDSVDFDAFLIEVDGGGM